MYKFCQRDFEMSPFVQGGEVSLFLVLPFSLPFRYASFAVLRTGRTSKGGNGTKIPLRMSLSGEALGLCLISHVNI